MTIDEVKNIVNEEIQAAGSGSRFGMGSIQRHTHNGFDSYKLLESNLTPSKYTTGTVTMDAVKDYVFNTSFAPSLVTFRGIATSGDGNWQSLIFGTAALGQNLMLQQNTDGSSSLTNTAPQIIQSCTFMAYDIGAAAARCDTNVSNLIYVERTTTGTIFIEAAITSYGQNLFTLTVSTLASGWTITGSFFTS